jgi:TonB-linked SusC/RagA family outer membrane protein
MQTYFYNRVIKLCLLLSFFVYQQTSFAQGEVLAHVSQTTALLQSRQAPASTQLSLKEALRQVEIRFGIHFTYNEKIIEGLQAKAMDSSSSDFQKYVNNLLESKGLKYKRYKKPDHTYFIYSPKERSARVPKSLQNNRLNDNADSNGGQPMTSSEESIDPAAPVDVTVSGKVTNDQNEGLPGVSVLVKGTTIGTTTDVNGSYSINVPENATLVFSFIGYTTEEIVVGNQTSLNVKLVSDIKTLGEVVVVGYGTQKQRELTTAVGSVTAKNIAGVVVSGLDQAMQGQISGVQVTQNSGEPGGRVSVRVRGLGSINGGNEPLYIVDGVPYNGLALNTINPNDIERIDVLKDAASSAIYGSRATNGVVLVTTKRAKAGKVQVSVDAYAGTQSALRTIPLLNGPQFAALANDHLIAGGREPNPAWSDPSKVPNTDWQNELFKTAPIQSYNVNISGGSERSRSLVSVGYFDQGGILSQSYYKRYTARINTDYDISSRFKVGLTVNAAFEEKRGTPTGGGNGSGSQGGLITTAISHPTIPLVAPVDGLFSLNPDGSVDPTGNTYYGYNGATFVANSANPNFYPAGLSNPVYAYENLRNATGKSQRFLGSAFGEYEIITGLKVRSTINLTFSHDDNLNFWQAIPALQISGRGLYGIDTRFEQDASRSNEWNWVNTISYSKTIDKHNFTVLAGTDALKSTSEGINVLAGKNPNDQPFINGSLPDSRSIGGGAPSPFALVSYLGRLTYDYAGKYLLTANIRRDGSSNFNPAGDYQYGVFPSASVGWIISEESFMTSVPFVSLLKLRASYGTVGNQGIGAFQYLNIYDNQGNRRQYPLGLGQTPTVGNFPKTFGTPDIRWEKSTQTDIGIDATFFNNSLSLTADYYVKNISDMLGEFPLANYIGAPDNRIIRNGFSMQNSGIELALGYNRKFGEVGFSVSANFTTLENKVTKLTDNVTGYVSSNISAGDDGGAYTRTEVGQRVGNFYGYVADGIFQTQDEVAASGMKDVKPGDRRYLNLDTSRVVNDKDRTIIGNGLPKYIFGFNLGVNYKGFDLSVLLNGQAGVQIANQTKYFLNYMKTGTSAGGINNGSTDLLQSWTGPGSTNTFTRNAYDAANSNRFFSTFNIEDGAFLRVRNIQLGYTLPLAISQKVGMSRTRIYVAAQNLFTFTKYSGYDPEIGSRDADNRTGNALQTGVDFGRYPVSRMFTAGVNFQF